MVNDPNNQSQPSLWAAGGTAIGGIGGFGAVTHIIYNVPLHPIADAILSLDPLAFGLVPAAACIAGAALGGWLGWKSAFQPAEIHVRGRQLVLDPQKAAKALRQKGATPGVHLHPQVPISMDRERRHTLIIGGAGSGKTTILWPVIREAVGRGDKALIFSFKGDFQESLEAPFSLLAPWDSRSAVWQLGWDIRTRLDAESLARTLVPTPEKDPQWAQGAQGLLTAVISQVQGEFGNQWGFMELSRAISQALSDYDALVQMVVEHSPVAKAFLLGKDSKTTGSYLATMVTRLSHTVNLGVAQYAAQEGWKPWSVRGWLAGKTNAAAILGFKPSAEDLSQAYGASILEQILRQVLDMPDAPPESRRIWLFLDEVPQLGKVPSITQALVAARSKGVRVVLGTQGRKQMKEAGYSPEVIDIWEGSCGSKIVCSLQSPADQKWAADLLGEREVDRYQSQNSAQSSGPGSRSGGYQRVREPVMLPAGFGHELYVREGKNGGPRALLLTQEVAALLHWPWPPRMEKLRPHEIPAAWTLPGFQRPRWGGVPPAAPMPPSSGGSGGGVERHGARGHQDQQPILQPESAPEPRQPAPLPSGGGIVEMAADHVQEAALDAIAPGLGLLDQIMEAAGDVPASSPLAAPLPKMAAAQAQPEKETENEHE